MILRPLLSTLVCALAISVPVVCQCERHPNGQTCRTARTLRWLPWSMVR